MAKTTSIEKKTMDIEERGVRLRLTIVDTPGEKYRRVLFSMLNIKHLPVEYVELITRNIFKITISYKTVLNSDY